METVAEKAPPVISDDSIQNVTKGGGKGSSSPGGKVNGEGPEVIHQNGEKAENGLENGESGPERRRSSRVKPSDKKDDASPSQKAVGEVKVEEERKEEKKEGKKEEKKEEVIEVEEEEEEVEEGEEEEVVVEEKVLRRSFGGVSTRTPVRAESRPSEAEVRNYLSGRISGRRSTRGNVNIGATPKRRAEEEYCDVGGKRRTLDESWTTSPSWSFISTPFSKLGHFISSSTPSLRSAPTSDSMIVNYDEETVRQLDDSDVDVETVDETSPPLQQQQSSSRWFCSLM